MITYTIQKVYDKDTIYVEGHCKSGDSKPTVKIANGSQLVEMDTGKIFFFDKASSVWREWA